MLNPVARRMRHALATAPPLRVARAVAWRTAWRAYNHCMSSTADAQVARYRHIWLHEHDRGGIVIGSFHPLYSVSWHDNSVEGDRAFSTVLHEGFHASALTGTFLHLALLYDYAQLGHHNIDEKFPVSLADHVLFHESLPAAADELSPARKISYYGDEAITRVAQQAAELVRLFCRSTNLPIESTAAHVNVLISLYAAIGDAYDKRSPYTGSQLLQAIADVVVRRAKKRKLVLDLDPTMSVRTQVREYFTHILSDDVRAKVVQMATPYLAHQTYNILAQIALQARERTRYGRLLSSLVNLWFEGALNTHVVYDPRSHTSNLITTQLALVATERHYHNLDERRIRELKDFDRSSEQAMYDTPFDYLHRGYMHKCLLDFTSVPIQAFGDYLRFAFGAFPAVLVGIFDLLVAPMAADYPGRKHVEKHMLKMNPGYADLLKNYGEIRHLIWSHLTACLPDALTSIVITALEMIEDLARTKAVAWPFSPSGLRLNIGGQLYAILE